METEATYQQRIEDFLIHLCDSFQTEKQRSENVLNFQGNKVESSTEQNLSSAVGCAMTGIRAGALVGQDHFEDYLSGINYAVKQHIPLVIHVHAKDRNVASGQYSILDKIKTSGAICLASSNAQQAIDFSVIAHRISELTLTPVVHLLPEDGATDFEKLDDPKILKYIGRANNHFDSPTPSQHWVFGEKRRTVPNWFSHDVPVLNGAKKKALGEELETIADREFFNSHANQLIDQAFAEFEKISGRPYKAFETYQTEKAKWFIASYGTASVVASKSIDELRKSGKKVGLLQLNTLFPTASEQLTNTLKDAQLIVAEPVSENQTVFDFLAKSIGNTASRRVSLQYGKIPSSEDFKDAIEQILNSDKDLFYLNLDLTRSQSSFPKHAILLNNIDRNYPNAKKNTLRTQPVKTDNGSSDKVIPLSVRQFKDEGPSYSSVSRFYNETGIFYQADLKDQLVADPFQAINSMPTATSGFSNAAKGRTHVPVFHPQNCRETIDLSVICPNAAMPTLSIGMEALIKAGTVLATANGDVISKITPVVKNLAKLANRHMASFEGTITSPNEVLPMAFENLAAQTKIEGEKYEAISSELKTILAQIGTMSFALTEPLFFQPEAVEKGTGEMFSLSFDTNACTGCSLCAAHCSNREITMEPETKERISALNGGFHLWEKLPDTSGETINRLLHAKSTDPFAAIMLSRNFYLSMGGSADCEGEAQRTLVRMVTATAESALQSEVGKHANHTKQLISNLKEQIQKELASGLPKDDLSGLQKAIDKAKKNHIPFNEIMSSAGGAVKMKLMDTASIQRKLVILKGLETLYWTLTEGPTGTGRARYGLAIHGEEKLQWAQEYPFNPFVVPTVVHSDHSSPDMINGLFQGQKAQILSNVKLLRRAELEAKGKYNPVVHDKEIAQLEWNALSDDEKALLAPIILITDYNKLLMNGGWNRLLLSGNPIKIVLLDNGDLPANEHAPTKIRERASLLISALSLKKAFVRQLAAADSIALFEGLIDGLRENGPALFILNTPDQSVHTETWQNWSAIAKLAVVSRMHHQVKFDAANSTEFLANGIDLSLNPSYNRPWMTLPIQYKKEDETIEEEFTPTWANHAFTLLVWQDQFEHLHDAADTMDVAAYLAASEAIRKSKKAVVKTVIDGELKLYHASDLVVQTTQAIAETWHTLQEMAGVLTPYPEKLRKEVTSELKLEFDKELASAKAEFENKVKENEQQQMQVFRQHLKDRLVTLAKQGSFKE